MFNKQAKFNKIELRWKGIKRDRSGGGPDRIIHENIKPADQDLKSFIIEERAKGGEIFLDYIIDGVDFAFWMNLNYYTRRVIGINFRNNICYGFNCLPLERINFYYQKIILRRILGQFIILEDALDYEKSHRKDETEDVIKKYAEGLMKDENKNTMLYCSGCCGDRLCGYFGIRVYQTETEVVWYMTLSGKHKIRFKKEAYFEAFKEYFDLINFELEKLGAKKVALDDEADIMLSIAERVKLIQSKHQIKQENFERNALNTIFKSGDIEDIDTGIYLANSLGYDIEALKQELEDTYNALPENEQNGLSWKILDHSEYFSSIELYYPSISRKAFLLYS